MRAASAFESGASVCSTSGNPCSKEGSGTPWESRSPASGLFVFAGYSYGGTVAFELAKRIEAAGDKVKFIGSFNLPLYTKGITRRLDWTGCLLNVAFFCDLFPYALADKLAPEIRDLAKSEQLARVMAEANSVRRVESGITLASLETWTELTFFLANIGHKYDPSGTVSCMDVFFYDPLRGVVAWREEFASNDLNFYEADGYHYTMISLERVPKFQQKLKDVL